MKIIKSPYVIPYDNKVYFPELENMKYKSEEELFNMEHSKFESIFSIPNRVKTFKDLNLTSTETKRLERYLRYHDPGQYRLPLFYKYKKTVKVLGGDAYNESFVIIKSDKFLLLDEWPYPIKDLYENN